MDPTTAARNFPGDKKRQDELIITSVVMTAMAGELAFHCSLLDSSGNPSLHICLTSSRFQLSLCWDDASAASF
jgi:hypothetical protein